MGSGIPQECSSFRDEISQEVSDTTFESDAPIVEQVANEMNIEWKSSGPPDEYKLNLLSNDFH
jgi:hypothetical protein